MPIPWGVAALGAVAKVGYDHFRGDQQYKRGAREAQKDRDFQERMRNTQWQAAVEDMRAAGLNPALAYSQGPNTAPGGSRADGGPATEAVDPVASALAVKTQRQQLQIMKAQEQKLMAESIKERELAEQEVIKRRMADEAQNIYFKRDGRGKYAPTPALVELLASNHNAAVATNATTASRLRLSRYSEAEAKALFEMFSAMPQSAGMQRFLPLIISMFKGR